MSGQMSYVLDGEQLIRLLHGAGGGMAAGNAALAASLGAQSNTIAAQSEQIRRLLAENEALLKRCADLERANFSERQWIDKVSLAREAAEREGATHKEMLGVAKVAAAGIVGHVSGGAIPPQLLAAFVGGGGGSGGGASSQPRRSRSRRRRVAEEDLPQRLGEAVRMVVERLSPETIDEILEAAEAPNPSIPGGRPTLVGVLKVIADVLPQDLIEQMQEEVGQPLFAHAFALAFADQ
jgi:hypothetical protein